MSQKTVKWKNQDRNSKSVFQKVIDKINMPVTNLIKKETSEIRKIKNYKEKITTTENLKS